MQRRDFLKLSATVGSSALLGSMLTGCSEPAEWQLMMNAPPATETATVCNICFWSCAARVHTQGSRLWKITGQPGDPHSDGRLCTRGTGGVGAYYDPNRLVKPLLRVTRNGQQRFEVASWDDAMGLIASPRWFTAPARSILPISAALSAVIALPSPPSPNVVARVIPVFSSPSVKEWPRPNRPIWPMHAVWC